MPETYEQIVRELKSIDIPFAENGWTTRPNSDLYGVVALDFEAAGDDGDNEKQDRAWEGSVDLYSKSKRPECLWDIEEILSDNCECAWEVSSIQWEQETGLFHWEWTFRVEG